MFGLRAQVDPQLAVDQLTTQTDSLSQTNTSGVAASELLTAYLRWTESARRALRSVFTHAAVRDLVESDHYWFLRGANQYSVRVIPAIIDELDERSSALAALRDQIQVEQARWQHANDYLVVVPDTSMFMGLTDFENYDWCDVTGSRGWLRVVLPLRVLTELDGLKDRGSDGQKRKARSMIRWLDAHLESDPRDYVKLTLPNTDTHTTLQLFTASDSNADADMTFVEVARDVAQFANRPSVVVSRDLNQTVRSRVVNQASRFIPPLVESASTDRA